MGMNMNCILVVLCCVAAAVGLQFFIFKLSLFKYFTLQSTIKEY